MDNLGRNVTFEKISDGGNYQIHLEALSFQHELIVKGDGVYTLRPVLKTDNKDDAFIVNTIKLYDAGNGNFNTKPDGEFDDHFRKDGMKWLKVAKKLAPLSHRDQLKLDTYYLTQSGYPVIFSKFNEAEELPDYCTASTKEGVNYYSRIGGADDNGRVTGTNHDYSYDHNLAVDEFDEFIIMDIPMKYEELEVGLGDNIKDVLIKLADNLYSFIKFNDIIIYWKKGYNPSQYYESYQIKSINNTIRNFNYNDDRVNTIINDLLEFNEHNKKLSSEMSLTEFMDWLIKYLEYRDVRYLSGLKIDNTVYSFISGIYIKQVTGVDEANLLFISDNLYKGSPMNVGWIRGAMTK